MAVALNVCESGAGGKWKITNNRIISGLKIINWNVELGVEQMELGIRIKKRQME